MRVRPLSRSRRPHRSARGAVAAEFVGIWPLLFLTAMLVLQALTAVTVSAAAADAARTAARTYARGGTQVAAEQETRDSLPAWLQSRVENVNRRWDGSQVTATVDVSVPAVVSLWTGNTMTGRATFERG